MGEHYISTEHNSRQAQAFMKSLLADVSALGRMIETGRIESGVRRIGAEQDMFLIDRAMRPAPAALASPPHMISCRLRRRSLRNNWGH